MHLLSKPPGPPPHPSPPALALPQPTYSLSASDPAKFVRAAGHPDVSFLHDRELSFEEVRGPARGHELGTRCQYHGKGGSGGAWCVRLECGSAA